MQFWKCLEGSQNVVFKGYWAIRQAEPGRSEPSAQRGPSVSCTSIQHSALMLPSQVHLPQDEVSSTEVENTALVFTVPVPCLKSTCHVGDA